VDDDDNNGIERHGLDVVDVRGVIMDLDIIILDPSSCFEIEE